MNGNPGDIEVEVRALLDALAASSDPAAFQALLGLSQIQHRRRLDNNINEPVGASDSMLTRERIFHVFDTLTALDRSVVGIHANASIFFAATDRGDEKASIIWCWFPSELVS